MPRDLSRIISSKRVVQEYRRIILYWAKQIKQIDEAAKTVEKGTVERFFFERADRIAKQQEWLNTIFELSAKVVAVVIPGLIVSGSEPGYINCGPLHIPFFMLGNLPPNEWLSSLSRHASTIQLSKDTAVCLSGSISLFRTTQYVNDIDLCEYFDDASTEAISLLIDRLRRDSLPLCTRVVLAPVLDMTRTDPGFLSGETAQRIVSQFGTARFRKFDYVINDQYFHLTELTNVMISTKRTLRSPYVVPGTYAQQEVIIGNHVWVPRTLTHPVVLGRYARLLMDQTVYYMENGDLAKATKRGLCLARILWLSDEFNAIANALESSHIGRLSFVATKRDLLNLLRQLRSRLGDGLDEAWNSMRDVELALAAENEIVSRVKPDALALERKELRDHLSHLLGKVGSEAPRIATKH